MDLFINNVNVSFKLDTGAQVKVINYNVTGQQPSVLGVDKKNFYRIVIGGTSFTDEKRYIY